MNSKIVNHSKFDTAVAPESVATSNTTGDYFNLEKYQRACFFFSSAAMAKGDTVVAQILKATDGEGAGSASLSGAAATITALANAKKVLMTANTIVDATTTFVLTVKDKSGATVSTQTYICEDTAPDSTLGQFASGADDDAAIDNLKAVVNSQQGDYVVASSSGDPLTISVKEPGEHSLTITGDEATLVPSNLEAEGYVEIAAEDLGDGFTHAALDLTTDATILVGGTLERKGSRYTVGHAVAASTEL